MTELERAYAAWDWYRFTVQWLDIAYAMVIHGIDVEKRVRFMRDVAAADAASPRPRWFKSSIAR